MAKIAGIKLFAIKQCHLLLNGLTVLFLIAMYPSVIMISRNCSLNSEKFRESSTKLHL